jgi:hypothetical protein
MDKEQFTALKEQVDKEKDLLAKHQKLVSVFHKLWDNRAEFLRNIVKKRDANSNVNALLATNKAESKIILLIENAWPAQQTRIQNIMDTAPTELSQPYKKIPDFAKTWMSVIGVHKKFLEIERQTIPLFSSSIDARKKYFEALESTLRIYSEIVAQHDEEKIIGESIIAISNKKLATFPRTTAAGFLHGWYRIFGATYLGAILFGSTIPGANVQEFVVWSLFVNIGGTILSFIDIKYKLALKIRSLTEEITYTLKPAAISA